MPFHHHVELCAKPAVLFILLSARHPCPAFSDTFGDLRQAGVIAALGQTHFIDGVGAILEEVAVKIRQPEGDGVVDLGQNQF